MKYLKITFLLLFILFALFLEFYKISNREYITPIIITLFLGFSTCITFKSYKNPIKGDFIVRRKKGHIGLSIISVMNLVIFYFNSYSRPYLLVTMIIASFFSFLSSYLIIKYKPIRFVITNNYLINAYSKTKFDLKHITSIRKGIGLSIKLKSDNKKSIAIDYSDMTEKEIAMLFNICIKKSINEVYIEKILNSYVVNN